MKGYKMEIAKMKQGVPVSSKKADLEAEKKREKENEKKLLESLVADDIENKPNRCRICGAKLGYDGLGEYTCPDCGHKEYDDYGLVRSFLEEHPGATAIQVEKGTGVSRNKITKMIADDKFIAKINK